MISSLLSRWRRPSRMQELEARNTHLIAENERLTEELRREVRERKERCERSFYAGIGLLAKPKRRGPTARDVKSHFRRELVLGRLNTESQ